jgi:hypothetical protein
MILEAARRGLRRAGALWRLVLFLLLVNVAAAAVLAVPMALTLRDDLTNRAAADNMLYGFDYPWWSAWADAHPRTGFSPEIFGSGFAFKNVDLLLGGHLPAGLFAEAEPEGASAGAGGSGVDSTVLALGAAYLLMQVFLGGGILALVRAAQAEWTVRGLLHGCGFYFGRLLRLAVVVLVLDGILFALYAPVSRWADAQAVESVSERTAMVWMLGRHLALLLALMAVSMVSAYARTLIVLEERSSAVLALLSAAALCLAHFWRTFGHVLLMAALGLAGLAAWSVLDAHWETTGYKTQIVTLVLLEALVFLRIFLRVATAGGQVALARQLTTPAAVTR